MMLTLLRFFSTAVAFQGRPTPIAMMMGSTTAAAVAAAGAAPAALCLSATAFRSSTWLGNVLRVHYNVTAAPNNGSRATPLPPSHQVFAVVNGSLLGAGVDVRLAGVVSVPLPRSGTAHLELVLMPQFKTGALYVGFTPNASVVRARSPPLAVTVEFVPARRPTRHGHRRGVLSPPPRVGIEYDLRKGTDPKWGPSGTPGGGAVEAVPLLGRYAASNLLAARQHALWMVRAIAPNII